MSPRKLLIGFALLGLVASAQETSLPILSPSQPSPNSPTPPRTLTMAAGNTIFIPDEPVPQFRPERPDWEKPGFWTLGDPDGPWPLRTNHEVFHDKVFLTTQAIWLGSIVYDAELTHQGLAHHNCVENDAQNEHPSRFLLYRWSMAEYIVGTGMNLLMMKYVNKPLIFIFPGYGSVRHFSGGSKWLTKCW